MPCITSTNVTVSRTTRSSYFDTQNDPFWGLKDGRQMARRMMTAIYRIIYTYVQTVLQYVSSCDGVLGRNGVILTLLWDLYLGHI